MGMPNPHQLDAGLPRPPQLPRQRGSCRPSRLPEAHGNGNSMPCNLESMHVSEQCRVLRTAAAHSMQQESHHQKP